MTVDEFIAKWQVSGGNERANTQLFVSDLCALLGTEAPQPTLSDTARNDYVARHEDLTLTKLYNTLEALRAAERAGMVLSDKERDVAERAAEEAQGKVRWLRPEFQAPGYRAPAEQKTLALPEAARPSAEVLEWPGALPEQVVAVAGVVERSGKPVAANDVARAFKGKRAATVLPVLDALAGMGRVRKLEDGRYAA